MEHGYPLARLATLVALARASATPTRLLLRNTERVGLVHLYFAGGRLTAVEGSRDTPLNRLADLATWQRGVVRRDAAGAEPSSAPDARLELALDDALATLAARGVVTPAPRARLQMPGSPPPTPQPGGMPSPPALPPSHPFAESAYGAHPMAYPLAAPSALPANLPPIAGVPVPSEPQHPPAGAEEPLTSPQWQLLALAVRQVVARGNALIGETLTARMISQALAHSARSKPLLEALTLEPSGWLVPSPPDAVTRFSAFEVVDAVADLLTGFETRCASLVGPERAHELVLTAVAPFRTSLAQIGLDVST
jgi:hypothetical protein